MGRTQGLHGEFASSSSSLELYSDWQSLCKDMSTLSSEDNFRLLNGLNCYDTKALRVALTSLQHRQLVTGAGSPPGIGKVSGSSHSRRIIVQSSRQCSVDIVAVDTAAEDIAAE